MYVQDTPKLVLSDHLVGLDGKEVGAGFRMEGTRMLWHQFMMIYGKRSQYCKVIILQLDE